MISPITIFAPAKVNLYLHVLGKRADGYHDLDSLVGFVDIGDRVRIAAAERFAFHVEGPFAKAFGARDLEGAPTSSNLCVKAAYGLARLYGRAPDVAITLEKHLPLGGGIGGGSADAAAVVWGMLKIWNVPVDMDVLMPFLRALGADVPVCFAAKAVRMRGIGDVFDEIAELPEMPVVLAYPAAGSATRRVFMDYEGGSASGGGGVKTAPLPLPLPAPNVESPHQTAPSGTKPTQANL